MNRTIPWGSDTGASRRPGQPVDGSAEPSIGRPDAGRFGAPPAFPASAFGPSPSPAASWSDPSGGRPDHTAEMKAIALQLERLSSSFDRAGDRAGDPAQSDQAEGDAAAPDWAASGGGLPPAGPARLDALRAAVAAIARRQADLDGRGDGAAQAAEPPPAADLPAAGLPATPAAPAALPPAARVDAVPPQVAPARPPAGPAFRPLPIPAAAREPSGLRRAGIDLSAEVSDTFARFSRDLRDAIHATDARPGVEALRRELGREMRQIGRAVDGFGSNPPGAEALARIGEQTREMRDLLKASTARSVPFDAVERQVASLEARLGRLAALPVPAAAPPDFGDTMAEVRALLGGFDPGATMAALEIKLDAITDRIERGLDARGLDAGGAGGSGGSGGPVSPSSLIEGLSRRVDEIHASLRSQLAEAAADTRPLEGLVRSLSERIGQARDASADFHQLEAAVRDVGAKIDGAAGLDPRGVQAVEAQLARLGERLDRSEASLRALDGVEHTLGELFSQFEVTRQVAIDAAETAARTAARDTLRAALQNPNLAHRGSDVPSAAVDQMARSLDDIRALQDTAERRTQSALSDIQVAMDRLIGQMAATTAGAGPGGGRASALGAAGGAADEPRRPRSAPGLAAAEARRAALDPAEQMIEPGLGRNHAGLGQTGAGRAEPRFAEEPDAAPAFDTPEASPASVAPDISALPPNADGDGPASFIAAARRAAQAAQASAASAAAAKAADRRAAPRPSARRRASSDAAGIGGAGPAGGGAAAAGAAGALGRARSFLAQRRRPILLSLAALVLLVGALEVVKLSADPAEATRVSQAPSQSPGQVASQPAPRARLASVAPSADAASADKLADRSSEKAGELPKPVLPAAVAPTPAPLPTFVTGPAKAPAPVDGISEGLRAAAAAGDAGAQYEVGLRYAEGRGTARDPKQAAAWFSKAAAAGSAPAEYRLGSAYEKGAGVERDPALATSWYGKAADAGNIRAMHNLAVMSAEGAGGKPDYAKAAQWFGKASTYGVRDSQFNLAILYARGLGIEQSLPQSYTWFAIAAAGGDDDAGKKRDEVAAKLDAKALAAAKAAAEAFHAATPTAGANEVAPPPGGWDAAPPRPPAPGANARVSQL